MTALLATAFTAGLVATVNPCGFAMLPAYLGYFIGLDDEDLDRPAALRRALVIGGVVSAGFMVVFGLTGAVIVAGLRSIATYIPWVALVIGVGLFGLGIALLRGFYLNIRLPQVKGVRREQKYGAIFMFGVSYAIASLSCTLPIFLSLVAGTFTQSSFIGGLAAFLAYGAGMSLVLLGITLAMALGKDSLVKRLRSASKYVNRISGAVMVLAGGFIVWYWATILLSGADALATNGLVRFIDNLSSSLTSAVGANPLVTVALLLAVVGGGAAFAFLRRPKGNAETEREFEQAA
ncbi:MAG: cytochrome c biogenesis protein CcdA [Acidimicrobiia bacterium]|nr:cytochrome c biogenesis protein CcdA [Acidimicrobiia bacterium]